MFDLQKVHFIALRTFPVCLSPSSLMELGSLCRLNANTLAKIKIQGQTFLLPHY